MPDIQVHLVRCMCGPNAPKGMRKLCKKDAEREADILSCLWCSVEEVTGSRSHTPRDAWQDETRTYLYSQSPIANTFIASSSDTHCPLALHGRGCEWHVRDVKLSKKWSSGVSCMSMSARVNTVKRIHHEFQSCSPPVPSISSSLRCSGAYSVRWSFQAGVDSAALRSSPAAGHG